MSTDGLGEQLGKAAAAGGGLGLIGSLFYGLFRMMFSREQSEYKRLEARILVLESAKDECLRREAMLMERIGKLEALESLSHGGPTAFITADSAGIITEWNPGATALLGWSHEEAIGKNVNMLVPHRLRQRHGDAFDAAAHAGRAPSESAIAAIRESFALRRDGSEIPVTISLSSWKHLDKRFYSAEVRHRR
jgi:PAS domain S-box-containing protein